MAKPFKRYFTGAANSGGKNGKGSWQRDSQTSDSQVSQNWCASFGHRPDKDGTGCVTCGASLSQKEQYNGLHTQGV